MDMFINGERRPSGSGAVLTITNPYDGSVLDTVPSAVEEDVNLAVAGAAEAQRSWAKVSVFERSEIVKRFVSLLDRDREQLAQLLTAEMGKPIDAARGELECARDTFLSFAEKSRHIYGEVIPAGCEPGTGAAGGNRLCHPLQLPLLVLLGKNGSGHHCRQCRGGEALLRRAAYHSQAGRADEGGRAA